MSASKLDPYLAHLLLALAEGRDPPPGRVLLSGGPADEARARVLVRFKGDVTPLESRGLIVERVSGPIASGAIAVANLAQLAELENVVFVEAEAPMRLELNTSVPEIHADELHRGTPAYTGAGVIVGIVDTGIDIFHRSFRNADDTTRILSIWDQTLPRAGDPPEGFFAPPRLG